MPELRWIYVTAPGEDEAMRIGETIVRERLAACANVMPGVRSVYWWQGELCRGREAVLILKTTQGQMDRLVQRVLELHTDAVPCVEALRVVGGNSEYQEWVGREVGLAPGQSGMPGI